MTALLQREALPEAHVWWRVADPSWSDPLDPAFARRYGGRWNPPGMFPVLYLNEDPATARLNLRAFIAGWPYEPEDLRACLFVAHRSLAGEQLHDRIDVREASRNSSSMHGRMRGVAAPPSGLVGAQT